MVVEALGCFAVAAVLVGVARAEYSRWWLVPAFWFGVAGVYFLVQ